MKILITTLILATVLLAVLVTASPKKGPDCGINLDPNMTISRQYNANANLVRNQKEALAIYRAQAGRITLSDFGKGCQ